MRRAAMGRAASSGAARTKSHLLFDVMHVVMPMMVMAVMMVMPVMMMAVVVAMMPYAFILVFGRQTGGGSDQRDRGDQGNANEFLHIAIIGLVDWINWAG